MTWIKENRFLSAFLLAMVVGVGVLGYLLLGAYTRYNESLTAYQDKTTELSNLQTRAVFPSQKNLDKLAEQKKQVAAKVVELAKALEAQQIPVQEITPAGFQDKLKAAVNALKTRAAQAPKPVALGDSPERFFMGFEMYENAPPDAGAAAALGRQLKVIEWVVGELIDSGVSEITSIVRPALPEEKGKGDSKGDKDAKTALRKNPFEISFIAKQGSFKKALNGIVNYKGQFLIPRAVIVKSGQEKGPPRVVPGGFGAPPPAPAPPNPDGTPAAPVPGAPPPAATASNYIVGEEKVDVRILLEAVEFGTETPAPSN